MCLIDMRRMCLVDVRHVILRYDKTEHVCVMRLDVCVMCLNVCVT